MKLPPKPQPKLNAIGKWVDPTNKELMKWGRACAEAMQEECVMACKDAMDRRKRERLAGFNAISECTEAIRNIKIEEE